MSKQYSTRILDKSDESEIQLVLRENPLWKLKHARDCVARRKFQRRITDALDYCRQHPPAAIRNAEALTANENDLG